MISSNIEASITLDRDPAQYAPGEAVTGVLRYTASKPSKVKSVSIAAAWETTGKGNTDDDEEVGRVELQGEAELVGSGEYAFEVLLPHVPVTYHGTLVKIGWEMRARFARPWAVDGTASHPFSMHQSASTRL